ncbi:MAG: hypothetical protein LBU39_09505 [Desulfobulbaceae bacterium]|jgi:hypothetical protein|nr:hypothetical protein [Desulfobulbaceae bacterium]
MMAKFCSANPIVGLPPLLIGVLFISLCACQPAPEQAAPPLKTCRDCHAAALRAQDDSHQFDCQVCHRGVVLASSSDAAHQGLVAWPAAPDRFGEYCGGCHEKESSAARKSRHFTLASYEKFRAGYGGQAVADMAALPICQQPRNVAELADDLVRRRCLRCHLAYQGEAYPATRHGLGCAACHFERLRDGGQSHRFIARPSDGHCLACHYGNRVGGDYYGLFQHDLPPEYKTPFMRREAPYGIESHQLIPDIHQERGLFCIDCHRGGELMATAVGEKGKEEKASCAACHDAELLVHRRPAGVSKNGDAFIFTARDGAIHPLPTLAHADHQRYGKTVACQACHAQWSFDDQGQHFIRVDADDLDAWRPLSRQGVAELDQMMESVIVAEKDPGPPAMSDPFTGEKRPGVWLLAYGQRRWEHIRLERVGELVTVVRPLNDIFLSWLDVEGVARFDNRPLAGENILFAPYTPHTTGAVGMFRQERLRRIQLLERDQR